MYIQTTRCSAAALCAMALGCAEPYPLDGMIGDGESIDGDTEPDDGDGDGDVPFLTTTTLRAATYNIHYGWWTNWNGSTGTRDLGGHADVLVLTGAEVVCLNEVVGSTQAEALRAEMSAATGTTWRVHYATASSGVGNAILSEYPLSATAIRSRSVSGTITRNMVKATVTKNGRPFHVFCTHLASETVAARLSQSQTFRSWAASFGFTAPHIVMGDFNTTSSNSPIVEWTGNGYADSWARAATRTGYSGNTSGRTHRNRIDYVLARYPNKTISAARVWDTRLSGTRCDQVKSRSALCKCSQTYPSCQSSYAEDDRVRPSDHIPLTVDITFR